jgi:hypothetical protein
MGQKVKILGERQLSAKYLPAFARQSFTRAERYSARDTWRVLNRDRGDSKRAPPCKGAPRFIYLLAALSFQKPNPKTKPKTPMHRNVVHRESVIKHEKSKLGTPLSVYQVSGLALELSRQPDGSIGADFEQNFERAFNLLTEYQEKLGEIQEQDK